MPGMRNFALLIAVLTPVACGTPAAEDADDTAVGGEIGADEDLGSAVGLEGVAASRGEDADSDQPLTRDDFSRRFGGSRSYDGWDANGDGRLSRDEFHLSAFSHWDTDGDRRLSQTEWRQGTDAWLDEHQAGLWEDWDADGDGSVSPAEYNRELNEHNLYDTWDRNRDGTVDPEELGYSLFGALDRDANNQLDEQEWQGARE